MRRDKLFRAVAGALGLLACLWATWGAARAGQGRLLADYALQSGRLDAADVAVGASPADAEAHYARAAVLMGAGSAADAAAEYERATALRPHDYALWLGLGEARDAAGDAAGALAAFTNAAREAPAYAEPRWQLGNALLRASRTAEAFDALRRAARTDPQLYPRLLDLAWYAGGREPARLVETVNPQTPAEHVKVARFLAGRGATTEAVAQFRAGGTAATESDRRELTKTLLAARSFAEGYDLWAEGRAGEAHAPGEIADGGFEQTLRRDDVGFGWQFSSDAGAALAVSLDATSPRAGTRSLRLDFNGNSAPGAELLAQLVLASPGSHYRLRFSARTEELVTGGPLIVHVAAAGAKADAPLVESAPLPVGTNAWRDYAVEFTAPADARALRLVVARQGCAGGGACPAFGHVWLDEFRLDRL
ncbi:MAG: tetratricopeptide repeat protein [Pyrinomonadaceae bacterium]